MSRALSIILLSAVVFSAAFVSAKADPYRHGAGGRLSQERLETAAARRAPAAEFYTQQVAPSERVVVQVVNQEAQPRPVRPRSVNVIDPGATVSRTPSGRVFIGPSPNVVMVMPVPSAGPVGQPYAPPQFHMIGSPAGQGASGPVKLTYGVQPPETFRPGPKVVWLDEAGRQPDDDAGGRIKRLK